MLAPATAGYSSVVPKGPRYRIMRLHQAFRYRCCSLALRRRAQFLRDTSLPGSRRDLAGEWRWAPDIHYVRDVAVASTTEL